MLHELEFFLFDDENVNTKVAQNGSLPEVKRGTNNTVIYFCYYTPITCGRPFPLIRSHCSTVHVKEIAVNFVISFFIQNFETIIKFSKQIISGCEDEDGNMIHVGENVTKSCVLYNCESYQNNLRYLKVLQGGKQNNTVQLCEFVNILVFVMFCSLVNFCFFTGQD